MLRTASSASDESALETFLVSGFVCFCFVDCGAGATLEATLSFSLSEEEEAEETGDG